MVAVARPELRKSGNRPMSKKLRGSATAVVAGNVPAPVRVRLKRVNCDRAIPYPPDGQALEWWQRLKNAFGTTSSAFVNASLQQLIAAARLPKSGISEPAVNASLAFIEGAKPEGEVECALVIQMACTHTAAMAVLQRLGGGHGGDRSVAALGTAAARLLRAYATQVETLRRWKNGGSQVVRVEHVHVNEGGQALIGNVRGDGGGKDRSPTLDLDSSSQQVAHAPHPTLRSPNAERELVPGARRLHRQVGWLGTLENAVDIPAACRDCSA